MRLDGRHLARHAVTMLLAVFGRTHGAGVAATCPNPHLFSRWLTMFEQVCSPPSVATPAPGSNSTSLVQDACGWVSCPCLEVSLQVPVVLEDIAQCYEEGVAVSTFTEAQRRSASELIRGTACGDRARELGSACGECDRFAAERPECSFTTMAPLRVFIAAGDRPGPARTLLGALPLILGLLPVLSA
mmetsp:Transcript_81000/g.241362  ORF Transcript_81000/g.241362 Transcript_81000/m.241362 type:complete len:187 (-) Transcript_81000:39-599(-)